MKEARLKEASVNEIGHNHNQGARNPTVFQFSLQHGDLRWQTKSSQGCGIYIRLGDPALMSEPQREGRIVEDNPPLASQQELCDRGPLMNSCPEAFLCHAFFFLFS